MYREINFDNALQELKDLKDDQKLLLNTTNELLSILEVLIYKKPSIEELTGAVIRQELEDNSIERLYELVDEYAKTNMELNRVMNQVLAETLGKEAFLYLKHPKNNFYYYFDFHYKVLIIQKETHSCTSCAN